MISVDRDRIPTPASLTGPNGAGYREKMQALNYYQTPQNKAYPFAHYKGNDVVSALNSLFHAKCAYCEGKIAHTGPIDVEHFRPKGKVEGEPNHLGYWWLATEWTNLLSSCIDCNRARYQTLFSSEDNQQLTQREGLSGKHNHFPIVGPRATCTTDNLDLEEPLLIDPTRVNPENHINWRIVGDHPLIIGTSENGLTSIDLLGLNRSKLIEARRELQLKLDSEFIIVNKLISAIAELPNDVTFKLRSTLNDMIEKIYESTNDNNQYSSFAKYYVEKKISEVEITANELLLRAENN